MHIRRLTRGDERDAAAALSALRGKTSDPGSAAMFLADASNFLFVAERDGELAGLLVAYKLQRCDCVAPVMLLYELEVSPAHRRNGVGRALLESIGAVSRRDGCTKMWALTNRGNVPAVKLYQSAGAERRQADEALFEFHFE